MTHKHNDGSHIQTVINRNECKAHNVPAGTPCYVIPTNGKTVEDLSGVCGERIRAAGYVGQITETSVQTRRKVRT